jgi:hypothetical protein
MGLHARGNNLVVLMFDVCLCAHVRAREWVGVCKVCGYEGVINTSHNPRVVATLANS